MLDDETTPQAGDSTDEADSTNQSPTTEQTAPKRRRRAASRPAGTPTLTAAFEGPSDPATTDPAEPTKAVVLKAPASVAALFQPPAQVAALPPRRIRTPAKKTEAADGEESTQNQGGLPDQDVQGFDRDDASDGDDDGDDDGEDGVDGPKKRRRRRGGRRRRKPGQVANGNGSGNGEGDEQSEAGQSSNGEDKNEGSDSEADQGGTGEADGESNDGGQDGNESQGSPSARRRRRRQRGPNGQSGSEQDDPPNTVVHVRGGRANNDKVTSVRGSTRLEAKKQRRREGREATRGRTPILSEAEFLARRESVDRVMVVRQNKDRTQIAVLEDGVLSEHYVNRSAATSMVGNVYLGRVQNVLPSMEAAFVDVGRGRNAVLYAGEVNWDAAGLEGQPKRIELALKSGDAVLVQVTKDPVGQKGARLTSMISLPGRYLVYVPGGSMTGISRRLPDSERSRLKKLLRTVLPEDSGVIVRTAAEGATEEQILGDVQRLTEQWERLSSKTGSVKAPELLHAEPDLATRVVRDIFNEDFSSLIVSGDDATATIEEYVAGIAPDLKDRVTRWAKNEDVFAAHRIDEQLAKALDRKVWLPSGGSLVIDHTEAMTVVDVNTGRFTGQGGNLEETVTRNNLEAAEEVVRQLRLRDTGGIIVIDFIDMVLESNRDFVLRRLLECLGRDRTKHQVAEVTSLGLVQMTRKRIGQGLLETFSTPCDCCNGRGVIVQMEPVDQGPSGESVPAAPRRRVRPTGPIPGAPIAPKAEDDEAEANENDIDADLEAIDEALSLHNEDVVLGLVDAQLDAAQEVDETDLETADALADELAEALAGQSDDETSDETGDESEIEPETGPANG